jgi:hypothetical protein
MKQTYVPFVVEVGKDNMQAFVLLTEQVLLGHKDVIESNIRGTGGGGVGSLDWLGLDTGATLN